MIQRPAPKSNPDAVLRESGIGAYAEDWCFWPKRRRMLVETKAGSVHLCEILARVAEQKSGWRIEVREWKGGAA